jgi:hypothetical protein
MAIMKSYLATSGSFGDSLLLATILTSQHCGNTHLKCTGNSGYTILPVTKNFVLTYQTLNLLISAPALSIFCDSGSATLPQYILRFRLRNFASVYFAIPALQLLPEIHVFQNSSARLL